MTNYGDRSTPENIAGTHLVRCAHMLMLQHKRLLTPEVNDFEDAFGPDLDATFYAYALRHAVQVAEMCRPFNNGKVGRAIKDFRVGSAGL